MAIPFTTGDWSRIKASYQHWWQGTLERPLLHYTLTGYDPRRTAPACPDRLFDSFFADEVTADQVVDTWDYRLSGCRFAGDAFPAVWPNFGPGVAAAFLGCELENGADTVWFAGKGSPLQETQLSFVPASRWYGRVQALVQAAMRRWQGQVQVGMTDLGGTLDIIASFRGSEPLLMDLYDVPSEVHRLVDETHEVWWRYFDELDALMRPLNPGYTAWTPILSETPYYMLQCDFAYMIGPDMFREFVVPELTRACRRLKHAFYHLDGIGQLPHLDALLEIPELVGIQWIPGAGQKHVSEWPEVLKRIQEAGKRVQIFGYGNLDTLDILGDRLGSLKGLICIDGVPREREGEVERLMRRFGAA